MTLEIKNQAMAAIIQMVENNIVDSNIKDRLSLNVKIYTTLKLNYSLTDEEIEETLTELNQNLRVESIIKEAEIRNLEKKLKDLEDKINNAKS